MTITAHINVETPAGRKILRELDKHPKLVEIEYPEPLGANGLPIETIPFEQSAKKAFEYMGQLYGVKFKNKYTK
jgi:hypothetical protein